jgi:hypothetical protein
MLNADLYRSSHGRSVELDPGLARQVTDHLRSAACRD